MKVRLELRLDRGGDATPKQAAERKRHEGESVKERKGKGELEKEIKRRRIGGWKGECGEETRKGGSGGVDGRKRDE